MTAGPYPEEMFVRYDDLQTVGFVRKFGLAEKVGHVTELDLWIEVAAGLLGFPAPAWEKLDGRLWEVVQLPPTEEAAVKADNLVWCR